MSAADGWVARQPAPPGFGLNFYIVNAKGEHAGVSMYASTYAVCTEHGGQVLQTEPLYSGSATD